MMKTILLTILLLSTQLFANVATITALRGQADIQRTGNNISASLGASLEEKDNILTQDNTKLQIIFKDETIISIGKNSDFSISEYLFEDNQTPIAKFSMLKGAMRTITGHIGDIAPQKFSVTTRTATIGIRGTNFSVVVGEDGSYQAYCTYGAISVTIAGIEYVVQQGFFITIAPDGKVLISAFTPKDLKEMRDTHFGVSTQKDTRLSKSDKTNENNEQLNVTIDDDTEVIIAELERNMQNIIQPTGDVTTYVMNDAFYTGDYTLTYATAGLPANGDAELSIDFGADTLQLVLDPGSTNAIFSTNPTFGTTTFNVNETGGGGGAATGSFGESTGNSVTGNFTWNPGNTDIGTYNVTSSQTLY
ncbi:MAG: FecR family protein [Sulfurimonas sp.]|nr:FecR family protein [Sulfurimonas sp.]